MKSTFENVLIVSDLDGTFFGPNATLLQRNLDAIRRFQLLGGTFTVASGRDVRMLLKVFPSIPEVVNAPAVLCNGAYRYDFQTDEISNEFPMDQEKTLRIIEEMLPLAPGSGYSVHTLEGLVCPVMSDRMENVLGKYGELIIRRPLDGYRRLHWHKTMFSSYSTQEIEAIFKRAEEIDLHPLRLTSSSPYIAEFGSDRASKGQGALALKRDLKKDLLICVGNERNDLDMLEIADIAACPSNSSDPVKEKCSVHLCDHAQGCIADLIDSLPTLANY